MKPSMKIFDSMKRLAIILISICAAGMTALAQQIPVTEANYDLAERFAPAKTSRMVGTQSITPNWLQNSDSFWYMWKDSSGEHYYMVNPAKKTKTEIFDMDRLAMELTEIIRDPFDAQHIPFQELRLKDDNTFAFEITSSLDEYEKIDPNDTSAVKKQPKKTGEKKVFRFEYDIKNRKLTDVTEVEKKEDIPYWASVAPDSSYVVYVKGYDLYYTDMENLRKIMKDKDNADTTIIEHRLTSDGSYDVAYGGNDYTGVEKDRDTLERYPAYTLWSPDSKHFITQRYDMSNIRELWVINSTASPRPVLETYKYQMPGEPGPAKTYLHLFDMSTKQSRTLDVSAYKDQTLDLFYKKPAKKDMYAEYVAAVWEGNETEFYFARLSRDLYRVDICRYDIAEDSLHVLVEERLNTYIDVYDTELLEGTGEMVVRSERNGWAQLYLHGRDGKLVRPITNGAFHVKSILEVDEKARVVYFIANGYNKGENPYYNHLMSVKLDGGEPVMLTPADYDHRVSMPESAKYFVSGYSRVDAAPVNVLYSNTGKKIMDLEECDLSQLIAAGYRFPEIVKVKACDGVTDLWGVIYKPFDFDSTKCYPIIEYVYPGPQVESVLQFWTRPNNRMDRLAQLGFVVVTIGHRGGHPDRSKWYHNYGYGDMRDYPLADHKYALQQLAAQRAYMDINRVGITGHSGGGFMSTAALLTYPDFYDAAVSCAGNHDNRIYNRWWSETHHGVEEVITESGDTTFKYDIEFNQQLVRNLKGHLLLVTGDMDNNVHPANTTRVVDALIKANKRFDMLYLPNERHSFLRTDEYFFWKMADYFCEHLIGDCEDSVDIRQINNN